MVHRLTHREPQCQNALFRRVPMCDARKRRRYRAIPFLWHLSLGKIRNSCRLCQKAIAAGPGETVICRGDRIGKEDSRLHGMGQRECCHTVCLNHAMAVCPVCDWPNDRFPPRAAAQRKVTLRPGRGRGVLE
jgi:hypothetical protein